MDAIKIYSRLWTRSPPPFHVPSGSESCPNFFTDTLKWTTFFCFGMVMAQYFAKLLFPKWYNALDPKKQAEFPPYLLSLVHHVVVISYGWWYLIADLSIENYANGMLDYSRFLEIIPPFILAFILGDTLYFAIPQLVQNGNYEYILHHVLAILLFVPFLYGPGALVRFYPHLMVCESSALLFNVAWLMRLGGMRDSPVVFGLEMGFVLLFFVVRFVNLSIVVAKIFFSEEGKQMGMFSWLLPAVAALQWYWMFRVVQALTRKVSPNKGSKEKKSKE